jgi:hypothetical protein
VVSPSADVIVMAPFIPALKWSCTLQRNSHRPGTSTHQQLLIHQLSASHKRGSRPHSVMCAQDICAHRASRPSTLLPPQPNTHQETTNTGIFNETGTVTSPKLRLLPCDRSPPSDIMQTIYVMVCPPVCMQTRLRVIYTIQ